MAGIAALTRYDDSPPLRHGIAYLDLVGGYHGALAMLAGLHEREHTGEGRHIILSQRDAAVRLIGDLVLASQRGVEPSAPAAPHGIYPAKGHPAWLALSASSDEAWQRLCAVMDRPDLAAEPRFADAAARQGERAAIDAAVSAWSRELPAREAAARLNAAGIVAAPVNAIDTLFDDPQLAARAAFVQVEHHETGRRALLASPFLIDGERPPVRFPAPDLGQHNEQVLAALPGFDGARLREMEARSIIGSRPQYGR
jgi:crotonobetainyl-CoA:carnitine CoA-transferase CaiB-like acyl-CoA transferase